MLLLMQFLGEMVHFFLKNEALRSKSAKQIFFLKITILEIILLISVIFSKKLDIYKAIRATY